MIHAMALDGCLILMSISILIALIRLIKGPYLVDRIAALDLIAMICICIIGVIAIKYNQTIFLDVALALGLIIFLSTVAFARYLEKGLQS